VMLGPGCEEAALAALNAWPGMLFPDIVDLEAGYK
jgi:hypothetical protein